MTSVLGAAAMPRRWPAQAIALGLAFVALAALRSASLHDGLLYPDGYQYLLMARGIAEHLEPVTVLGPGGDRFAPNPDAAMKPFFPALVALGSSLGLAPLDVARALTTLAGAAVPVLVALLALRLGAGRAASVAAALACAISPTLTHWAGYTGPDALAQALALGSAVALLHRRPVLGGAAAALCILTRPDYAMVALAALLAGLAGRKLRPDAVRAGATGIVVVGAVLALIRPPLELPAAGVVAGLLGVALLCAALLLAAGRMSRTIAAAAVCSLIVGLAVLDGGAWASLARQDWALAGLAAAGIALGLRSAGPRTTSLRIVALCLPLAAAYWSKNPGLARYVSQLVPELALVAAVGMGTVRRLRTPIAVAACALAIGGLATSSQAVVGTDAFQEIAPRLGRAPEGPLVTAAPDAYGVLLPGRTIRAFASGAEGLVLVDGAARAYAPGLRVEGAVVKRIPVITGFRRPDGAVDRDAVLLYRGRVVKRR